MAPGADVRLAYGFCGRAARQGPGGAMLVVDAERVRWLMAGNRAGRGKLHLFLAAAPGAGKTSALLAEGCRRAALGDDVVVGLADTHGRPDTEARAGGLEVVPLRRVAYRGTAFDELDLSALLARRPQVVLVDELAHSVIPGAGHDKRWQDVADLLEAGIDVVSCLNVQHLESLADKAGELTGITVSETVPDAFAAAADRVDLLDAGPEELRARIARLYPPGTAARALTGYFRLENLAALAALGRRWIREQGFGPTANPSSRNPAAGRRGHGPADPAPVPPGSST